MNEDPNRKQQKPRQGRKKNRNKGRQGGDRGVGHGGVGNPGGGNGHGRITARYNFASLTDHVFRPEQTVPDLIDVPFRDALSGTIELVATAKTPVFVRGPGIHPEEPVQKPSSTAHQSFNRLPDGKHALPGPTVKGMLRNVLEIASFSALTGIDGDRRYAVRDLANTDDRSLYLDWMTSKERPYKPKPRAGWLYQRSEKGRSIWEIQPCEFARVDHDLLERETKEGDFGLREDGEVAEAGADQEAHKAARKKAREMAGYARRKYEKWGDLPLVRKCAIDLPTNHGGLYYAEVQSINEPPEKGIAGTLVFTGQPSNRGWWDRTRKRWNRNAEGKHSDNNERTIRKKKHLEFVFYKKDDDRFPVPGPVRKDFLFIHGELDRERKGDWNQWWSEKLRKGEPVPVFYLAFPKGEKPDSSQNSVEMSANAELHSMGLALMYRLAYRKTVGDALPTAHREVPRPDVSELIFGRVRPEGLRGRVQIEPFPVVGNPQPSHRVEVVLASPKPTFYPNYLKQEARDGKLRNGAKYQTFQSGEPRLRGWKRYPVRGDHAPPDGNVNPDNQRVASFFRPLPEGTQFEGVVHFHNLRLWELGALLWAITFGEPTNSNYRHSLGMAKALGYGSIHLTIRKIKPVNALNEPRDVDINACLDAFRGQMQIFLESVRLPGRLEDTEPVQELCAMARQDLQPSDPGWLQDLIRPGGEVRDFARAKTNGLVLRPYSEMLETHPPT